MSCSASNSSYAAGRADTPADRWWMITAADLTTHWRRVLYDWIQKGRRVANNARNSKGAIAQLEQRVDPQAGP